MELQCHVTLPDAEPRTLYQLMNKNAMVGSSSGALNNTVLESTSSLRCKLSY